MTQRTLPQNNALHLYCEQLAEALSGAGYDVRKTLRHDIEIPWDAELIKKLIWKKVQETMTGEKSTTKLDKNQVSDVYEVINRHTASTFGVSVPFPSVETLHEHD